MKTVLRITRAYFAIVPLQSWLTLLGGILLFASLVVGLMARTPQGINAMTVTGMLGAVCVALVPALAGGTALRFASSRSMLYLRPYGRLRMLAATTLAITVLASLVALPVLLSQLASRLHGIAMYSRTFHPGTAFAVGWSVIGGLWMALFVVSGSRILSFLLFLPLFIGPRLLIQQSGAASVMPGPFAWLAAALVAWLLFAIWYLQARSFRTPRWAGDISSQNFESSPPGVIASLLDFSRGVRSAQRASSQLLLGVASPLRYALMNIAWCAAFLLFFSLVSPGRSHVPDFRMMLAFASLCGAQVAYMITRRARRLWLRTGSDRASLFALAERDGLLATLWFLLVVAALLAVYLFLRKPEQVAPTLLFAFIQIPVWTAAFYCGLSLTRWGGSVEEVILCIGVAALLGIGSMMAQTGRDASLLIQGGLFVVASLLTALLRTYARRKWIALDWRIAHLPAVSQPGLERH